jgi:hypothetical protein
LSATDDDDDSAGPNFDFSRYDGTELLNIDWSQLLEETGEQDCFEVFDAFGENTTFDDQNLCPACDEVWAVTLAARDDDLPCLEGTGLSVLPTYVRRVGIEFGADNAFRYWRNRADSDNPLTQHGIGAFQGVEFTWSGSGDDFAEKSDLGFTFFFSGEGEF